MSDHNKKEIKQRLLDNEDEEEDYNPVDRNSQDINGDYNDENGIEEDGKEELSPNVVNLGDLPQGTPLESILWEDQFLVPNSTRKAFIAKWDKDLKRHKLTEKERNELQERDLLEKWDRTVEQIHLDPKKQPMNNDPPFLYRLYWGILRLLLLLVLLYVELILCEIFLMNVVIIGLCIWFHLKTMVFTNGIMKNKMYSYKHREFKRFLNAQKEEYSPVELIPGKEGKWIEIKLEEDENDSQPEYEYANDFNPTNRSVEEIKRQQ